MSLSCYSDTVYRIFSESTELCRRHDETFCLTVSEDSVYDRAQDNNVDFAVNLFA